MNEAQSEDVTTRFLDGFPISTGSPSARPRDDPRLLDNGLTIEDCHFYADEPFLLRTGHGAWLASVSVGDAQEGDPTGRTVIRRSTDRGRSWSQPLLLEPLDGPEASRAALLKTDFGRIYVFYLLNADNTRAVIADDPPFENGLCTRVDVVGQFVFRYSDDDGVTWSPDRYLIPVREFDIDAENPYHGKLRFGWISARPFARDGRAYVPITKVGSFGEGWYTRSEGVLAVSDNILAEPDPARITWDTWPQGRKGIRAPAGARPIAEEHSYVTLSDGTLYCVYRTVAGWPATSRSFDGGRTWTSPAYVTYADGRRLKSPRAANRIWRCENGKYLYWHHNHGGAVFAQRLDEDSHHAYEDRNPAWLSGGVEDTDTLGRTISWSAPEIVLYADDPMVRMSYPDLLEDGGGYFIAEANKHVVRVHEIEVSLLQRIWPDTAPSQSIVKGLLLDLKDPSPATPIAIPPLPDFVVMDSLSAEYRSQRTRHGFSLELWLTFSDLTDGQVLVDSLTSDGRGFSLKTAPAGRIELAVSDDFTDSHWATDYALLGPGRLHHVVAIVDSGPNLILFVVDGILVDGGEERQFGWGRLNPFLETVRGGTRVRVGPELHGNVIRFRLYNRALRTSEAIANWRFGL